MSVFRIWAAFQEEEIKLELKGIRSQQEKVSFGARVFYIKTEHVQVLRGQREPGMPAGIKQFNCNWSKIHKLDTDYSGVMRTAKTH